MVGQGAYGEVQDELHGMRPGYEIGQITQGQVAGKLVGGKMGRHDGSRQNGQVSGLMGVQSPPGPRIRPVESVSANAVASPDPRGARKGPGGR